jgi:dienelactone hydrolase
MKPEDKTIPRTIHTEKYYTSLKHIMDEYDREARKLGLRVGNISDYDTWKKSVRSKLMEITGIDRMEKCELEPVLLESCQLNGYKREKKIIQTEPDVWMTFNVLIPEGFKESEKRPCIITPHGHCGGGKYSPAGRYDIPAIKDAIDEFNYDYGVKFVQQGYIVFCPDARGAGERREFTVQGDEERLFLTSACSWLNRTAISLGKSVTGMWTWDLMRLIDYIETLEHCDSNRIGCCGLSGGGLQTLWLSALDDRVKCAVVSGYFYGYKDSLLKTDNCDCNYVPHLWEYVDMGDIGALIAPRPFLIETGIRDTLNGERGVVNVTEQVEITHKAYELFNAEEKLYHHIFEDEHRWNGKMAYSFVDKWV